MKKLNFTTKWRRWLSKWRKNRDVTITKEATTGARETTETTIEREIDKTKAEITEIEEKNNTKDC